MAGKMQIDGPYRVRFNQKQAEWEIVELVNNKPVQLRPRLAYAEEKRTSAYRRLALMNRKWQKAQEKL